MPAAIVLVVAALSGCAFVKVDTAVQATQAAQVRIIERDIAFMYDTVPVLRFRAPPVYAMWRAEVEECSGLKREGAPSFWIAPTTLMPNQWLGMYIRQKRQVVLALGAETVAWIVRHEYLHDLINEPGHPAEFFGDSVSLGRCGHLTRRPLSVS